MVAAATRPIAGLQERCPEFLGMDLMHLERRLRPDAYGRVRGGYIARRPPAASSVGGHLKHYFTCYANGEVILLTELHDRAGAGR